RRRQKPVEKPLVASRPSGIGQLDVGGIPRQIVLWSGPQPICSALRCRSDIRARQQTVIEVNLSVQTSGPATSDSLMSWGWGRSLFLAKGYPQRPSLTAGPPFIFVRQWPPRRRSIHPVTSEFIPSGGPGAPGGARRFVSKTTTVLYEESPEGSMPGHSA